MKKRSTKKVVRKPKPIEIPEERDLSFTDKLSIEFLMWRIKFNTFVGRLRTKIKGY